jgi:two-component system chemotaxis response regulator CheB
MSDAKIRVLIVDDSATIRSALKIMIRREPDMEVVGTAANGMEALRQVADNKPDVVLMDIEMPVMNGIDATEAIMDTNPVPVVIFSSVAAEAAPKTLEALDKGAVDFITKDGSSSAIDIGGLRGVLLEKLRQFGRKRTRTTVTVPAAGMRAPAAEAAPSDDASKLLLRNRQRESDYIAKSPAKPAGFGGTVAISNPAAPPRPDTDSTSRRQLSAAARSGRSARATPVRLVAIGSSTGGPQALQTLVRSIPANLPVPVVVVQHIPASFVPSFAKRLGEHTKARVKVAEQGERLHPGTIHISPGDHHLRVMEHEGHLHVELSAQEVPGVLHMPSVDVLFQSAAACAGAGTVAAVLTGMGKDGAAGAAELHDLGASIVAQDEATSVVYGMPRAVAEDGNADQVLPLEAIGDALVELVMKGR